MRVGRCVGRVTLAMFTPRFYGSSKRPDPQLMRFCTLAANASSTACSECSWWSPPSLIRPLDKQSGAEPRKPTLAWFFCITQPSSGWSSSRSFVDLARVAALSGRLNAPSLAPYMVYLHPPNEAPQTDEFTRFLEAIGVRAIHHNLTFWDTVAASPFGTHSPVKMGSYCRLDLPQLVTGELNAELRGRALPTDRILYTDTDVIIGADVRFPVDQPLRTLAAADEGFGTVGSLNSGVLLMHTSFMVSEFPHFLDYGKRHKFHFQVHDLYMTSRGWTSTTEIVIGASPRGWGASTTRPRCLRRGDGTCSIAPFIMAAPLSTP